MTMMIANKYEIQEKIGKGSFGFIYQGMNLRTREKIAIKVEPIQSQFKLLKNETVIYQYLKNVKGIPHIKWFGKDVKYYYMVIQLLGKSLESILKPNQRLSLYSTIQIGIQLLELIETIHQKGLIHRDLKPDNFLFGLENTQQEHQLYLIDFGFCKSYLDAKNEHILHKKTNRLIGSANYASIHSHNHEELSRRDDLESIGYIMYSLYYGYLEWSAIPLLENYEKNNGLVCRMKQQMLFKTDLPHFLKKYFQVIRQIAFDEVPHYRYLTSMIKNEMNILNSNKTI